MANSAILSYACVLVLVVSAVTSSPIEPVIGLHEMHSDNACLFMCEMCFSGHMKETMYCANHVCGGECNAPGLAWLGRTCKNPDILDKYLRK